jgi:predicted extracellular nuclease/2',3'-cyclic-nucleotide 2'-phosphodiesterase (5'-nucleotidase family)
MSKVYFNLAGGNLSQNWTDTSLISADDNWANVPSFEGFLGQNITTTDGVNPGTLLTDSTVANDLDVQHGETNPDSFTTGGVAEFEIADPTIALNGSGTADAPHLIMYLNATGRQNVVVSFSARDLDGSTDNAVMPIAVQYRIGETGNWTNLPPAAGIATDPQIADATTGPSLATLVTPISVTLPSDVTNQAQVQVRFITANAVGNDEWVGIDNIQVTSDIAPQSVRFATNSLVVAKSEGDGGPTLLTFTVERLGSTDGQVDFTANLTAAATSSANSADFTGSPTFPLAINGSILAGQTSGTFTVSVNGDTDVEVNENFTLTIASVNNATFPAVIDTNQDEATGRILADDFTGTDIGGVAVLAEAASLQGTAATPVATDGIELVRLGSYAAASGNAEVLSFDPTTDRLYILNATGNTIEIVQIASTGALSKVSEIDLAGLTEFGGANSVAIKNGIVAVAYGNVTPGENGFVALFNAAGVLQGSPIEVGVLPDMVTFTPDGGEILVANEAEAVSTSSNANGTISIIDLSAGAASATVQTTVGFTALNGSEAALDGALGLSLFPGQTAAADIEPEYIAVSPDGTRAYVTLQEVNAVAVIDLTNPAATSPLAILPLGSVDRSLAGNAFDPSDQDGIDIANWNVRSLLQPDAIATFTVGGETYFVTANEGDARVGTGLTTEEVRLGNASYNLDDTLFPNEATLKDNANLGRLNVINHEGDTDGDGDIDVITTYGGRGISIFKQNADGSIEKVRETGGEFERILSQQPNANFFFNGENTFGSFDSRSDNKGPEPEGVDIGVINGRTYAFVVLERAGGVMIYDVTDPANASFVGYKPPLPPSAQPSPDNAPETVKFISAADSPTGTALVVTANEVGNATTVYAAVTPIYQIQGTGHLSALDGQTVSTTGVVTAVDSNGFYIQDPNGDGNAATSDGIFVFTSSAPTVTVGQSIMVTGVVDEFVPNGAAPGFLPVTQIVAQNANVQVLGLGEEITAVEIGGAGHLAPPTSDISDGAAFFEALEGMLVKVNNPIVVSPTNSNGEIFTVVDNDDNAANGVNATGLNARGVLQLTPGTPIPDDPLTPGSDALRTVNTTGGDFNPERIQIDDDSGVLAGFESPDVNPGAKLNSVTGVVSYNFANCEVIATQAYTVAQASTLAKETTALIGTANRMTVASYNAENLDHLDPAARFTTIADEVINRLKSPDVIALQEIQDNDGAGNTAITAADLTLDDLVDAINAAVPAGSGIVYAFIDNPFIGDDTNGGEPGGNIRTAFLYRTDRVDLVDNSLRTIGVNGVSIDNPASAEALDQRTNVDNPFFGSRPPLVATFEFNGNEVTVVNNHFTSKGGSGAVIGSVEPPLNASEVQRAAQAQAVNNFVDNLLAGNANAKVMVAGDLNEFPNEEPMSVLKGIATITGYDAPASGPFDATATYVPGGTAILQDLLESLPANEQYDYVFDGNAQTLDHMLVTNNLATGAQFDVVRINAEFHDQTSDHDPLVAAFDLPPRTTNYTLQLLHLADGEAGLLASQTAPNLAALVDAFDDDYANTLIMSGGDNWLPGPFAAAGTDLSVTPTLNAVTGSTIGATTNVPIAAVDIAIHNEIGVEISSIGNHEFDLGSRVFRDSFSPNLGAAGWVGANFVHVSANLDFSGDPDLNGRFTNTVDGGTGTLVPEASTLKGRIAPAAVITKGGEKIGFVGATTQILEAISSPSGTEVKGFPTGPGANGEVDDMDLLASQLQPIINELIAEGVNKIIVQAHLQQIENEQLLATKLRGVDIILSAGSNTRLGDADDEAVAFPGHGANFAGTYPLQVTDADGKTTLIVNTDNEYTYLGRLVVEFDANGEIIPSSLTNNQAINGAYASTAANVAEAWNTTVGNLETTAFAEGTKGNEVRDLTTAVQNVINVKDGNVFGYTEVYLEGERGIIRSEETNLGDLSADANAHAAREALGDAPFLVSLKNGGGIRAQIGTLSPPDPIDGTVDKLPPPANPVTGKPEGGVSQLDVENSLRFNNRLMVYDTTPQGLLNILNHGAGLGDNNGGFPQVGGVKYSYDPDLPAGSRIRDIALIDQDGKVIALVVDDGVVVAGTPALIRVVTLNFTANGGDGYPVKANGDNFRFLLTDGTLSAPVSESLDFVLPANVPANAMGEQQAFGDYMDTFHGTPATAFDQADTPESLDIRIQNLNLRSDAVFSSPAVTGTAGDDVLTGSVGNDTIDGLAGNDFLFGNALDDVLTGGAGIDFMAGGAGNDAYFVDNPSDQVVENPGEGTDTVNSTDHFRLSASLENLVLQGGANLQGYGNALANTLTGNAGINLLSGGGGDDTYFVDNTSDAVLENANEGNDTVHATDHFRLSANVENLMLEGSANLQGYGNELANTLTSNTGVDLLVGGAGDDTYVINNAADYVLENVNEGTDTVLSSVHFGLAADVENLTLTGSADLQGYGNGGVNVVIGNNGNNLLNGGAGADTMQGGAGNDVYFVDDVGDTIVENPSEGIDAVFSTVSHSLAGNVETLVLQGSGNLSATGNGSSNTLYGNSGDNTLDGGAGADALIGNAGNDTFVFHMGEANGDIVVDFTGNGAAAGDSLQFIGYGPGATFTNVDATHWQVNFNGGASHDIITFSNGAAIDASDFLFA